MRAIAAIGALALFAGCSSGPNRPSPPGIPVAAPLVIRWEPVVENTDGSALTDVSGYEIEVLTQGKPPTRLTESADTREVVIPVPFGPWTVRLTAVSASLGAGETVERQGVR